MKNDGNWIKRLLFFLFIISPSLSAQNWVDIGMSSGIKYSIDANSINRTSISVSIWVKEEPTSTEKKNEIINQEIALEKNSLRESSSFRMMSKLRRQKALKRIGDKWNKYSYAVCKMDFDSYDRKMAVGAVYVYGDDGAVIQSNEELVENFTSIVPGSFGEEIFNASGRY